MAMPDIDGALVGGASLDPDEFARIVQFDGMVERASSTWEGEEAMRHGRTLTGSDSRHRRFLRR
jgi:hypothetical protein